MSDLKDKVVVITGAASGIGRATAQRFSSLGSLLVLVDLDEHGLNETIELLNQTSNDDKILKIIGDLSEETFCKSIIDDTIKHFNRLDVLINNAGIFHANRIDQFTTESFDRVFTINVRAPILLTHLAIPHLVKTKGNVVNVSSAVDTKPHAGFGIYSASKSALSHVTKTCAIELASSGIRVNAVAPGVIMTPIYKKVFKEGTERFIADFTEKAFQKRLGTAEEVVNAIAFLASNEDASFICGHVLTVDGANTVGNAETK